MGISYPITLPTSPTVRIATWHAASATAITESDFDGSQQVQSYDAQRLIVECEIRANMTRAEAEEWVAALLSLYGAYGTCLFGDTSNSGPRGSGSGGGTPCVYNEPFVFDNGQLGRNLVTLFWPASTSGVLKAGDWIQIAKNQLLYPKNFDNAAWTKNQCTVAGDATNAPDAISPLVIGQLTADRFTPTGGATDVYVKQSFVNSALAGRTFRFRVWLKAVTAGFTTSLFLLNQSNVQRATQSIALTTSWQQFEVSVTVPAGDTTIQAFIGGANTWVAANGGVDAWGASLCSPQLDARLHKVLQQVDSGSLGVATLPIYAALHSVPPEFSEIITASPKGQFRLVGDDTTWTIDQALKYGLKFTLAEAY